MTARKRFRQRLSEEQRMLIVLKSQLYDGRWDAMLDDLKNRLAGKPYIFKLVNRIKDDIAHIEQLQAFELEHKVDLADFVELAQLMQFKIADYKGITKCFISECIFAYCSYCAYYPFRFVPLRSECIQPLVPTQILQEADLGQVWQVNLAVKRGEQIQKLSLLGDKVCVMTDRNYMFCLNRNNGKIIFGLQLAPGAFPFLSRGCMKINC